MLYDTRKELSFDDYKPVNYSLKDYSLEQLEALSGNLEQAVENAYLSGSDLLAMAIDNDLRKVDLYIKMKSRKQDKNKK